MDATLKFTTTHVSEKVISVHDNRDGTDPQRSTQAAHHRHLGGQESRAAMVVIRHDEPCERCTAKEQGLRCRRAHLSSTIRLSQFQVPRPQRSVWWARWWWCRRLHDKPNAKRVRTVVELAVSVLDVDHSMDEDDLTRKGAKFSRK